MRAWDIRPEAAPEAQAEYPGLFTLYVIGVLLIFGLILAIGIWTTRRGDPSEHHYAYRTYFVLALLWPLFIASVVFVVLWNFLTCNRNGP